MEKLTAFFMGIVTFFASLFGSAGSNGNTKLTGVTEAINALSNKSTILETVYEGEKSTYTWSSDEIFDINNTVTLTKDKGKDFVILNLTDIHFADYDQRAYMAFDSTVTARRLVAAVQPDLITVSGDIVCSESTVYAIKRVTDLLDSFGVPWAPVFGNHDDDGNCDLNYLADVMLTSKNCLFVKGDPEMGVGNYVVNIAEDNGDGTKNIVESLVMMDSHSSQINDKQRQWLSWVLNGINSATNFGSEISLLMHIPLPEYQYAYTEAYNSELNSWNEGYNAYGELNETICCERDQNDIPVQRGTFDILKSAGTVKNVICGHDHMNDFSIVYDGIRLTYTMKIGFASGFQYGFNGGSKIIVGNNGITDIIHKTASYGMLIDIEKISTGI